MAHAPIRPRSGLRQVVRNLLPAPVWLWIRSHREWHAGRHEVARLDGLWEIGRTFVDVGANLGLYTQAARGHGMNVVAIEPHPHLARNLRRLFLRKVRVVSSAASDRVGSSTFYLPTRDGQELHSRGSLEATANEGFAQRSVVVNTKPLDDMGIENVALMKIDVEGHELSVLRGALALLRRDRPTLLVEIEERHHPGGSAAVFELLRANEYDGYFFYQGAVRPVADFEPARHQPKSLAKSPDGASSADYVNDFLFIWRENSAGRAWVGARSGAPGSGGAQGVPNRDGGTVRSVE